MENVDEFIYKHIPGLVSAVGGTQDNVYVLGDEGVGCLADIKKWLLNYDTKSNKWETAHAISQTTLVETDLVPILAGYYDDNIPEKAALMALEITTHVTWPLTLDPNIHTKKHESQYDDLSAAQKRYKRTIITHNSHAVLKGAAALALPYLSKSNDSRSTRENSIINLVVNFIRNLLAIESSDRSALLIELEQQQAYDFLTLLTSSHDSITPKQAIPILDVLWGLVSGVDVQKLYTGSSEFKITDLSLSELLAREKKMRNARFKPTRHSRFGTLISLDIDGDGHSLSVSGQRSLGNDYLEAIGESKNWRKTRAPDPRRNEKVAWGKTTSLQPQASDALKRFVAKFLDTCYNRYFLRTKGFIGGIAEEFDSTRVMHYVYTLGWFASAERLRQKRPDFKLIGVALSYSMFQVVCDIMANSIESGPMQNFDTVFAGMMTLRSIFTLVEAMTSASDEWKEAAENILSRLFYDEGRLELFTKIPRIANKRTQEFQSETIELVHCLFKLLDFYASDKAVLYIKSKQRERDDDDGDAHEPKVRERKWDVDRYIKKFYHDSTIDLYQNALLSYKETDYKVLKHCLAFVHRLFIKKEMHTLFYRLPFMQALLRCTSSADGIQNPELLKGYHKLLAFYTKQLFKCADKSPSILIELLFRKSRPDVSYYDLGVLQEHKVAKKAFEYEYEFTDPSLSKDQRISICVAALIEDNHRGTVEWIAEALKEHIQLQQKETRLRPFVEASSKLKELSILPIARALTREIGLKSEPAVGRYYVPTSLGAFELIEISEVVEKAMSGIEEDPHNYLARSLNTDFQEDDQGSKTKKKASDSLFVDGESSEDEVDGFNDPRLQPLSAEELAAKQLDKRRPAPKKPTRQRAKRRQISIDDSDSDSGSDSDPAPKKKKAIPAIAEAPKYKSSAFVHDSDDESDEERDTLFFEQELARAREKAKLLDATAARPETEAGVNNAEANEDMTVETDPSAQELPIQDPVNAETETVNLDSASASESDDDLFA